MPRVSSHSHPVRPLTVLYIQSYLLTTSQPVNSKRTPAQYGFLAEKYSQFLDHQANKTANIFFPPLYEEYFKQWPPMPTDEDIADADGDVAVAGANVRQEEESVRDFKLLMLGLDQGLMMINRRSTAGCITVRARSTVSKVTVLL